MFDANVKACEDDFDRCSPCVASAACTACYNRHRRCLKNASKAKAKRVNDCLKARVLACFDMPEPMGLARAKRHVLKAASTPEEIIDDAFAKIDQLVLAAGPDGVTPEVNAQIEAILADAMLRWAED
jgi:hypothetical protein